ATSFQSRRTGCDGVASSAGLSSVGTPGVGGVVAPGSTVKFADCVELPKKPVIVTDVLVDTGDVVTVKLAKPSPPGTSTIGGGCATEALLVASVTVVPPGGALALRNTVPFTLLPPVTPPTLSVIDTRPGGAFGSGVTLTKKVFVTPPAVAFTRVPVGSNEA